MKIDIEIVKELLRLSKQDIYVEDLLGEKDVTEGSEKEERFHETFTAVHHYIIERLQLRLAFMEVGLEEQQEKRRSEQ